MKKESMKKILDEGYLKKILDESYFKRLIEIRHEIEKEIWNGGFDAERCEKLRQEHKLLLTEL